jgi:hypothetical protein
VEISEGDVKTLDSSQGLAQLTEDFSKGEGVETCEKNGRYLENVDVYDCVDCRTYCE